MIGSGRSFSGRERNCCFLNTGAAATAAGRFANISAVSGLDYPDDGRAVALVDWDHDGDLDMWISNRNAPRLRLMRNDVPGNYHFLALRLEGNGKTTNRDAIGARVEVVIVNQLSVIGKDPSKPQYAILKPKSIKTLRAGEGFLAQSSKWLHFGLGAADVIEKVTVHWPGGEVEPFGGLDPDRRYRLVQGEGTARDVTLPARETKLVPSIQKVPPVQPIARIPVVELLTVPRSHYLGFDGKQHDLATRTGRLLLVNLWASWCGPCLAELSELAQRYDEIQAKGIDILALSVDGLGEEPSTTADAARLVSERKFPFPVGRATSALVTEFQELHNLHLPLQGKLSLPSSFLMDRQGRLSVIYKGPVSVDELLKDVGPGERNRLERFARSAPIAGQPIGHPQVERIAARLAVDIHFDHASRLLVSGRADQAARQYADVLKFKPDSHIAHNNLGNALDVLGRHEEAIAHYREAQRLSPDDPLAYYNLAIVLESQGKIAEAIEHYRQALRIKPDHAKAHTNLGAALNQRGRIVEAIEHFHQALRINPHDAIAHYNLANALQRQEKIAEAIHHFQQFLQIKPDNAMGHYHLANALRRQGKIAEAIEHYQQALRIKPDDANVHTKLGVALNQQGKTVEAIEHLRNALRINPDHVQAHTSLGIALEAQGDFPVAIRQYRRALELNPNSPLALNNLARIRATHPGAELRDGAQAVELAERCCQLTGYRMAPALDTLAAAYAEAGRFDDAVRWQTRAIELAPAPRKAELEARLELYKAGKPYREKSSRDRPGT